MRYLSCILVFSFFAGINPGFTQDRFLRKAKSALDEGDVSRAVSHIANYESKTGLTAESNFMRHLVNKKYGSNIAQLDDCHFQLKFAVANHAKLSPRDQQDWCEEIGFCAAQFPYLQRSCDTAVFRAYSTVNNIDTISIFLTKYPQSSLVSDARILKSTLAFRKAVDLNTEAGYQAYLKEYGSYSFADSANKLMSGVAFNDARASNRLESYENFLKKYPESAESADAKKRVWELAWEKIDVAQKKDYLNYVSRYPESPRIGEALSRLEDFDWKEALAEGDIPAYENFVANYPKSSKREQAESKLERLIRDRDSMKLLAEAESNVTHLQLYHAAELLAAIDPLSSENIIQKKDSLTWRIEYVRPLLNQALGRYSFRSQGVEGVIVLGVDEDSTLFSRIRIFKDGVEVEELHSDGTFDFGLSDNQLDMNWDLEEFNNTLGSITLAQEQRKVILKLQNGTIYRKQSANYLAEIGPTPK